MTQPQQLRQAFDKLARMRPEFTKEEDSNDVYLQDKYGEAFLNPNNPNVEIIHSAFSLLGVSVWIVPAVLTDNDENTIDLLIAQFHDKDFQCTDAINLDTKPPFDYHTALIEAFIKYVEGMEEVKK